MKNFQFKHWLLFVCLTVLYGCPVEGEANQQPPLTFETGSETPKHGDPFHDPIGELVASQIAGQGQPQQPAAQPAQAAAPAPAGGSVNIANYSSPEYAEYLKQQIQLQEQKLAHQEAMHAKEKQLLEEDAKKTMYWKELIMKDVWGIVAVLLFGLAGMAILWIQSAWMARHMDEKANPYDQPARRIAMALVIAGGIIAVIG